MMMLKLAGSTLAAVCLWAQPRIVFSTYLGGRELDSVNAAAFDRDGNILLAGQTYSRDFPVAGPVRTSCTLGPLGGCTDAFVAKLAPDGSRLIHSIYYGTPATDEARGIAPAADGGAWVTGTANNAVFLMKLASDGRQEFVRTIPTYPLARAHGVASDRWGNAYVTGETLGPLPMVKPLQGAMGAASCTAAGDTQGFPLDAFVMKFNAGGELLYSTYFGGGGNDAGQAVAVDWGGNIHVAGSTSSRDLPLSNPVQRTYSGGEPTGPGQCEGGDGFLAKISADGQQLLYSTYSGTTGRDRIASIDVSPEGYATVLRSGPAPEALTLDPDGRLVWERSVPPAMSLARDRAGAVYLSNPSGYAQLNPLGLGLRFPVGSLSLLTSLLTIGADGSVLVAGSSSGGMPTINAVQPSFAGIYDGAAALALRLPEDCSVAVLVNAASYRGPYAAADSWVSVFGCDLAGATSVDVADSAGSTYSARIFARTSSQLNLVLPAALAPGEAKLTVRRGSGVAAAPFQVERTAPALFSAAANGEGPPAALVLRVAADGSRAYEPVAECDARGCRAVPIRFGGANERLYLILFGTGFRFASPGTVSVMANGIDLPVLGFAAQSEYEGLDQVNVELPRGLAGAGEVEVLLAVGRTLANPVTIRIE